MSLRTPKTGRWPGSSKRRCSTAKVGSTSNSACCGREGQWVWLSQRAAIIEDETFGCRRLVGVAFDITERKREAEISATADQRLREAVEAISEAFVLWDSANRLVLCNSKYQRLHNLPQDAARAGISYAELAEIGAAPVVASETLVYPP